MPDRVECVACPICDEYTVWVRHEAPEPAGMGGHYPGGTFVDNYECDCADRLEDGTLGSDIREETGVYTIEEYESRVYDQTI